MLAPLGEVITVKKEVSPTVTWIAVVVVVLVVIFLGYRFISGPPANPDKKGEDEAMKRVKSGGMLYQPPANAPVPGAGGKRPDGTPTGVNSYNLQPPSH